MNVSRSGPPKCPVSSSILCHSRSGLSLAALAVRCPTIPCSIPHRHLHHVARHGAILFCRDYLVGHSLPSPILVQSPHAPIACLPPSLLPPVLSIPHDYFPRRVNCVFVTSKGLPGPSLAVISYISRYALPSATFAFSVMFGPLAAAPSVLT